MPVVEYPDVRDDCREEREDIDDIGNHLIDVLIEPTRKGLDYAKDIIAEIVKKQSEIKQVHNIVRGPLVTALTKIDSWFSPIFESYEEAKATVKCKLIVARSKNESATEAIMLELEEAVVHNDAAECRRIMLCADLLGCAETLKLSTPKAEFWDFEIENKDAIPSEYLVINQPMLRSTVQLHKGATDIPGIRAFRRHGSD